MNRSTRIGIRVFVIIFSLIAAPAALAYVGPGAGLSLVGALWGLVLAVGAAIGFLLMWPIRRLLRRRRHSAQAGGTEPTAPDREHGSSDESLHQRH